MYENKCKKFHFNKKIFCRKKEFYELEVMFSPSDFIVVLNVYLKMDKNNLFEIEDVNSNFKC